jgi:hypothetical protein
MTGEYEQGWNRLAKVYGLVTLAMFFLASQLDPTTYQHYWAPVLQGQAVVLNIWFAFTRRRLKLCLLILLLAGTLLNALSFNPSSAWPTVHLLLTASFSTAMNFVFVAVPIIFGIYRGWRPSTNPGSSSTFTTATIIALTSLIALVLVLRLLLGSAGRVEADGYLTVPQTSYSPLLNSIIVSGSCVGFVACILSAVWSCLGNIKRLPACLVVIGIVCALPLHSLGGQSQLEWIRQIITLMAVIIGSLLIVRFTRDQTPLARAA